MPWPGRKALPWRRLGELVHPEPSPGPGCAVLGSSSVPAHPPPSSRKLKGHPGAALSPVGPRCSWGLKPAKAPGAVLGPSPCFLVPPPGTPELHSSSPGSVTLKPWSPGLSSSSSSDSVWPLGKPDGLLARGCGLDLLNRYETGKLPEGGGGGRAGTQIPGEGCAGGK